MTEQQEVAPQEATEEAVTYPEVSDMEAQEEGQAEAPPAEEPSEVPTEEPEKPEDKSESQKRRERDKAYKARLREERKAAEERAAAAEKRLAKIKGASAAEPKEADFADYAEYAAARAVWQFAAGQAKRDEGEAEEEISAAKEAAKRAAQAERDAAYRNYSEDVAEVSKRIADYDAVVGQDGLFPNGHFLPDLIVQLDRPAEVAYEIAKDRALHDRLLASHPMDVMREIGRIEARLGAPVRRTQSAAPEPINPVKSASSGSGKNPENMTPAEWREWRASGGTF